MTVIDLLGGGAARAEFDGAATWTYLTSDPQGQILALVAYDWPRSAAAAMPATASTIAMSIAVVAIAIPVPARVAAAVIVTVTVSIAAAAFRDAVMVISVTTRPTLIVGTVGDIALIVFTLGRVAHVLIFVVLVGAIFACLIGIARRAGMDVVPVSAAEPGPFFELLGCGGWRRRWR